MIHLPLFLGTRKENGPCLKGVLAHSSVVYPVCCSFFSAPAYSNLFPILHFSGETCLLKGLQIKMCLVFCHNKEAGFLVAPSQTVLLTDPQFSSTGTECLKSRSLALESVLICVAFCSVEKNTSFLGTQT